MTKKTNKIIAIFLLSGIVFAANIDTAKASVMDWFSSNINITGPNFEFVYATINQSGHSADSQIADSNFSLIPSNYLVASAITNSKNNQTLQKNLFWSEEISVLATGYSSTPDQTDDSPFITASGTHVRDGIIAANFYINGKKIPLGTLVKIPQLYGDRIFIIEDRMNSRYTNNIDIWFGDRLSALQFGAKRVKIQIINS